MKCKVCDKEYHYCGFCGYDQWLSAGYCDKECFEKSEFFAKEKGQFLNFLDRLDKDGINSLKTFLEYQDELLNVHNYYDKWIEEYKKG